MEELVPTEFFLSQNSPNPFKNSTKIKYCLPVKTKVNLTVFNSDGEKVKELANRIQEAGTYETILDGNYFKNGFYYYRLEADSFVETKKMLSLK
jgi:hypothetical protein